MFISYNCIAQYNNDDNPNPEIFTENFNTNRNRFLLSRVGSSMLTINNGKLNINRFLGTGEIGVIMTNPLDPKPFNSTDTLSEIGYSSIIIPELSQSTDYIKFILLNEDDIEIEKREYIRQDSTIKITTIDRFGNQRTISSPVGSFGTDTIFPVGKIKCNWLALNWTGQRCDVSLNVNPFSQNFDVSFAWNIGKLPASFAPANFRKIKVVSSKPFAVEQVEYRVDLNQQSEPLLEYEISNAGFVPSNKSAVVNVKFKKPALNLNNATVKIDTFVVNATIKSPTELEFTTPADLTIGYKDIRFSFFRDDTTVTVTHLDGLYYFENKQPPLKLDLTPFPIARRFTAYNSQIRATGGEGSYNFQITAGALPNGLTLSNTGVISGTTSQIGVFAFNVSVFDAIGQENNNLFFLEVKRFFSKQEEESQYAIDSLKNSAKINPFDNSLFFNLPENQHFEIRVFSLDGKKLLSKNINGGSCIISLSDAGLPKGIYIYSISDGKQNLYNGKFYINGF